MEHGLVHRLDTATHGLFVVALNQPAFDSLWTQQQHGAFIKIYTAFCSKQKNPDFPVCNFVPSSGEKITSYFRYYGKGRSEVRPVACGEKCGKAAAKKAEHGEYTTIIEKIEEFNGFLPQIYENFKIYSVQCALNKGFKHQIRAHLAWAGLPIIGDFLYCPAYKQYAARQNIAENFRGETEVDGEYAAWEYNSDSPLRDKFVSVFEKINGEKPVVNVIHAGLECGILADKLSGLDAISIGPNIIDIHTPRERLDIASTERTISLLTQVLEEL